MASRILLAGLVLTLVISLVSSQAADATSATAPKFLKKGRCSLDAKPVRPFDRNLFGGRWYRVGGIKNPEELSAINCTTFDYTTTATGMSVMTRGDGLTGQPVSQVRDLIMQTIDVGRFNFTSTRGPKEDRKHTMDIISTDYHRHACLVSCADVFDTHYVLFGSILNRKPDFDKTVIATCQKAMDLAGIPIGDLRGVPQGPQCNYIPL